MALEVLEPGLLTTVQDLGRYGYERYGVPVSGAMDQFALRAANLLVGNPPHAAALEITLAGPTLRATDKCLIAVTGADLSLRVNDWEMPPWMAIFVRQGWTITFGDRKSGCRAYLAVAGGIDVMPIMGSRSTYLSGGFGGVEGRALRQGDVIPVGVVPFHLPERAGRSFPSNLVPDYSDAPEIHVVLGPQDDYFTDEGMATFLSGEYQVGPTSDRMGYRLQGPEIAHKGRADIISDGIPLGAVQVPANRQPIVMMADRQTTGGYPKIATVISADVPLLAQCLPGQSTVRFEAIGVEEAQSRYRRMMKALEEVR
ncbi:MAG TPA: biotin-dependent carboxyltransferase [Thermoflexia bacterium]|nr:biotin-dependent carboxyltransferase [Thermoflexia bacterium]